MRYLCMLNGVVIGAMVVLSWPIGVGLGIASALVWAAVIYRKYQDSKGCDGL